MAMQKQANERNKQSTDETNSLLSELEKLQSDNLNSKCSQIFQENHF